jgi:hypothetical protein
MLHYCLPQLSQFIAEPNDDRIAFQRRVEKENSEAPPKLRARVVRQVREIKQKFLSHPGPEPPRIGSHLPSYPSEPLSGQTRFLRHSPSLELSPI